MRLNFFDRLWRLLFGPGDGPPAPEPPAPGPPAPGPGPEPPEVRELLALHNDVRIDRGVRALWLNPLLVDVARAHSEDQAARAEMGHAGGDGSSPFDRLRRAGYRYVSAGENVAVGYRDAAAVVRGWMNSPGHRANILRNYVEVGFGVAADRQGRRYWTAVFATPAGGAFLAAALSESCPAGLPDPEMTDDQSDRREKS